MQDVQSKTYVYIDGEIKPPEEAKVSIWDHGFLYGDGIFDSWRLYGGKVFKFKEHLDRLYESAHAINIKIPLTKDEMRGAINETVRANKLRDGHIRVIVTRGVGGPDYDILSCKKPTIIILSHPWPPLYREYKEGIKALTSTFRRRPPSGLDAKIKCLTYLDSILARLQASKAGLEEAIMLDTLGFIAEGTGDNLFIIKNKKVMTPLTTSALRGITRQTVMDLAKSKGFEVIECNLTLSELYNADESFLTGTAIEIVPLVEVDGRKIGNGKPGTITLELMSAYKDLVQETSVRIY